MTRTILLGTTAVAAALLTACGGSQRPAVAVISALIRADGTTGIPAMSGAQSTCVAGVLEKYVKPSDLHAYAAGKLSFADLQTSDNAGTQAGVDACLGR